MNWREIQLEGWKCPEVKPKRIKKKYKNLSWRDNNLQMKYDRLKKQGKLTHN